MEDGALGLSTSLQYVPDIYNSTDEIIAMAKVAATHGGVYFTHQRSEGNRDRRVARRGLPDRPRGADPDERLAPEDGLQAQLGQRCRAVLAAFEAARAEGLDVAANQYPWTAASNGLDACLPPWMREGGREKLLARLKDPALRERAKRNEMAEDADDWENQ